VDSGEIAERIELRPPLDDSSTRALRAGQEVSITGVIYTARDMAHKRLCESIEAGQKLPFELDGAIIYYVGPSPARPGRVIGSAGPTTSSRMDAFTPRLLGCGVKATMGKGYRSEKVAEAMQKYGAVHLSAIGGAGALLSRCVTSSQIVAYEDLGTEAVHRLEVVDFPAIVAYDASGNSVYGIAGTAK